MQKLQFLAFLLSLTFVALYVSVLGLIAYVAYHFISKLW